MGTLRMEGGRIEFRRVGASTVQVPVRESVLECFRQWGSRYEAALSADPIDEAALVAIGDEIGEWLHSISGMADCLRKQRPPAALEFAAPTEPNEAEWAFVRAPWELARRRGRWLAAEPAVRLAPVRRLGAAGRHPRPSHRWLAVMLMAPEPTDRSEGLRDAAERAIMRAVSPLKVDLYVEDTGLVGGPGALAERFLPEGGSAPAGTAFDVAHFVGAGESGSEPRLLLEDAYGDVAPASPAELWQNIGNPARLTVFSVWDGDGGGRNASAFAEAWCSYGAPAALAWDGDPRSSEFGLFSSEFYRLLANKKPLDVALSEARSLLLKQAGSQAGGSEWHRIRLYLGPEGGGTFRSTDHSRAALALKGPDYVMEPHFGDSVIAGPDEFVGRRRELQSLRRELRRTSSALLLTGPEQQGKSSLVMRLAELMTDHTMALHEGRFNALDILLRPSARVPSLQESMEWPGKDCRNPAVVEERFYAALTTTLARNEPDATPVRRPILLVLDRFDQCLEPVPESDGTRWRVRPQMVTLVVGLIRAFHRAQDSDSRLVICAPHRFELPEGLEPEALREYELPGLSEVDAFKQALTPFIRFASCLTNPDPGTRHAEREALISRINRETVGHVGLQSVLLRCARGNPELCVSALDAMTQVRELSEDFPTDPREQLGLLRDTALLPMMRSLPREDHALLAISALFRVPVTDTVYDELRLMLANLAGPWRTTLYGVGLWERRPDPMCPAFTAPVLHPEARAAMASLGIQLPANFQRELSAQAAQLMLHLESPTYQTRSSRRGTRDLIRVALVGRDPDALLELSEWGLMQFVLTNDQDEAYTIIRQLFELLRLARREVPERVRRMATTLLEHDGVDPNSEPWFNAEPLPPLEPDEEWDPQVLSEEAEQERLRSELEDHFQGGRRRNEDDEDDAGEDGDLGDYEVVAVSVVSPKTGEVIASHRFAPGELSPGNARPASVDPARVIEMNAELQKAQQLVMAHQFELAEPILQKALDFFGPHGARHQIAAIRTARADILACTGNVDEAIRIQREECIPVFKEMGDPESAIRTEARIAHHLASAGRLDEAIRILRDDVIPSWVQKGEERSLALTYENLAEYLNRRGDHEEALEALREQVLVPLEALEPKRTPSIQRSIAETLRRLGRHEEALEVLERDVLPALVKEGAAGPVADIVRAGCELLTALNRSDEIPGFRQEHGFPVDDSGDAAVRTAWERSQYADTLRDDGFKEALRIFESEVLPVYRQSGRKVDVARTLGRVCSLYALESRWIEARQALKETWSLAVELELSNIQLELLTQAIYIATKLDDTQLLNSLCGEATPEVKSLIREALEMKAIAEKQAREAKRARVVKRRR